MFEAPERTFEGSTTAGSDPAALAYFREQSRFTSPGRWTGRFRDLPDEVPGLCRTVQGLVVHYRSPQLRRAGLPRRRLREVDTRYVDRMLERLATLSDRPISESRPVRQRIVGCCRDFAVLFCAMARYRGIPARVRVGFATYFGGARPGFSTDHTIAEYWDTTERRWRLVDPEQSETLVRWNRLRFDPTDVPRDGFLVGGRAWQLCRAEGAEPLSFGVEPRGPLRGLWFVRTRLLLDLAAMNRTELLLRDSWDALRPNEELEPKATTELDHLAALLAQNPPSLPAVRQLFRSRRWRPPRVVTCFSPVVPPRAVRPRSGTGGSGFPPVQNSKS